MHSLKNTVVAILLLGVSYGVYQVITTPERLTNADQNLIDPLIIDDGLSATEPSDSANNPDIQLPAAAPAPATSSGPMAGSRLIPPKFDDRLPGQPNSSSTAAPTTESLVNRQANLDFTGKPDINGKLASAEIDDEGTNIERDQELIDALKEQLESNDESDSLQSESQPTPKGEMVSATVPDAAALSPLPGKQPAANSFAPLSSTSQPTPPTNASPLNKPVTTDPMSAVWSSVESMTRAGQFRSALETLTPKFGDPDLSEDERERLMSWLDALAAKVIYSVEHNMRKPYIVKANESLEDIAKRWKVTSQLVYNINKSNIANPDELAAGTELKMVQGPFHAEIDLSKKVMTLFVDDLYAGQFAVQVDDKPTIEPGQYGVQQKSSQGSNGQSAAYLIALNNGVCIQASSEADSSPSCIGLKPKDAADLFIIFTEQSQFFIKR